MLTYWVCAVGSPLPLLSAVGRRDVGPGARLIGGLLVRRLGVATHGRRLDALAANRDRYAAYNRTAPVERSSGGRVVHRVSQHGNRRLNHTLHLAAIRQNRQPHSDGRTYFERKLAAVGTANGQACHPVAVLTSRRSRERISIHGRISVPTSSGSSVRSPASTLLRLRVSQINNCTYCFSLHYQAARDAGVRPPVIDTLAAWWETDFHDDAARAALAYTEAITRVADATVADDFGVTWPSSARRSSPLCVPRACRTSSR